MTFSITLQIKLNNSHNCFVTVPRSFQSAIGNKSVVCFEVTKLDTKNPVVAHFGWSGSFSDDSHANISGTFASPLGFRDGDQIVIKLFESHVTRCRRAQIQPRSQHEWNDFEQYANEIEQYLMQQVRIVWPGLSFPFWINNNQMFLYLTVGRIEPESNLAILEKNTELERVRPERVGHSRESSFDDEETSGLDVTGRNKSSPSIWNRLVQTVTDFVDTSSTKIDISGSANELNLSRNKKQYLTLCQLPGLSPEVNLAKKQIFRVLSLETLPTQTTAINTVFINPNYAQPGSSLEQSFAARLTRLLSPNEQRAGKENSKSIAAEAGNGWKEEQDALSTVVRVQLVSRLAMDSVGVSDGLRRQMGLFTNSKVLLELAKFEQVYDLSDADRSSVEKRQKLPLAHSLTLTPVPLPFFGKPEEIREKVLRELRSHLRGQQVLLLSKGTLLRVDNKDLLFTPDFEQEDAGSTVILDAKGLDTLEVRVLPESSKRRTRWGLELPFASIKDLEAKFTLTSAFPATEVCEIQSIKFDSSEKASESELDQLVQLANLSFTQCNNTPCLASLLYGASGTGKSYLMTSLVQRVRQSRNQLHISRIDCHKLRGKRVEPLRKQLQSEFEESVYRQPSLLVIEDLDVLLPSMSQIEDKQERLHVEKCALVFRRLLGQTLNSHLLYGCRICITVTAKSQFDLHESLLPGSGEHFFQEAIQLQPPNSEQRASILRELISARLPIDAIDWNQLKLETYIAPTICDGYLPADLQLIVDKAIHNCVQKTQGLSFAHFPELTAEHFQIAASDYTPLSLRGLNLRPVSKLSLKHVGGLEQVKRTLVETLLWPTRYPSLFSQLPIRPQSSVLLYGAPGTGKTLLAEALANECGVRFVCVRGPELLSKYIGASEAAIRALFEKANQTAPCIVFFDEIDAIAPARGHDSTGVTDRVVNQILTQMDGIEQLNSGVHVLAATSRPDMVDRALLRPGRFDLSLYCPLPDLQERQQILNVLIKHLKDKGDSNTFITIDEELDFESLSKSTENFSGADLQALVYNAQLEAIHEHIRSNQQLGADNIELMLNNWNMEDQMNSEVDDLKELIITKIHFDHALRNTRPSVGPTERAKFERLYQTFSSADQTPDDSSRLIYPQKATLA